MTLPPVSSTPSLVRQLFPDTPEHARLLRLLLAQDGSATRLCEAISGRAVEVLLQQQLRTEQVPADVVAAIGGSAWLQRATTLHVGGVVLMDNLSFTRLDAVPDWFLAKLDEGRAPIGHLLDRLCVQRDDLPNSEAVAALLWPLVGQPDLRATKLYRINTPEGPLMAVFETFRAGWTLLEPAA